MLDQGLRYIENHSPEASAYFSQMDAQDLTFEDDTFDVVLSRNLTWNLEHPDRAYAEWLRVLRPGGVLLNFDANWHAHLFDPELARLYAEDAQTLRAMGYAVDGFPCIFPFRAGPIRPGFMLRPHARSYLQMHTLRQGRH